MDKSHKDRLLIKKEALKAKKGLVDAIQLLKDKGPSNRKVFNTDCWYLSDAAYIDELPHFKNLLDSLEGEGVARFLFNPHSALRWGDAPITIELGERFDSYADAIRKEYYSIEEKILEVQEVKRISAVEIKVDNMSEKTDAELLAIIRKAENSHVPGSQYQRASKEWEIRHQQATLEAMKSNSKQSSFVSIAPGAKVKGLIMNGNTMVGEGNFLKNDGELEDATLDGNKHVLSPSSKKDKIDWQKWGTIVGIISVIITIIIAYLSN